MTEFIQLRDYQDDGIDDLRAGIRQGHRRQVLVAPTGAGKSIIGASLLQSAIEKRSRVLFLCDRRVLVEQFSRHMDRFGIDHGIMMAGHWRRRTEALAQIASIQTLERMEAWPKVDLIIADEIHALMRASFRKLMDNRPVSVVGLTATPFHPALGRYFTRISNVTTMARLVSDGHLVPFRVFSATEIDTRGVKVTGGEWQKDELEQRGLAIVGDVVADYQRIAEQTWGGPRKTIVFSSGVAHGADLARRFADAGLNFIQISYLDDEEYKKSVLEDFSRPDTSIHGVISADILTRGFDQTDVEHVILARPLRKSFSLQVQMVGRGARSHPGKYFCVIQDHTGNWLRFLDSWNTLYHNGVDALSASNEDTRTRKEPTEEEKQSLKCPECGAIWGGGDTCAFCGYVREKQSSVIELPGEMTELSSGIAIEQSLGSSVAELNIRANFYRGLLGYAAAKKYKDGWAWHAYRSKFGENPPRGSHEPSPPSPEVMRWVTHLNIKYARKYARNRH